MNRIVTAALLFAASATARADINVGSDGSDGPLNVTTANLVIDLSQAPTAAWDTPAPQPGKGVYDPDKWAVVFKYSSINIASGRQVTFINHPSRAPVVWLVQGTAVIAGSIGLDGTVGTSDPNNFAEPGPGGFRGGRLQVGSGGLNNAASAGCGPGGGQGTGGSDGGGGGFGSTGTGGSIGGMSYGNQEIIPLIGGSGGHGGLSNSGGGGGGGAILIAVNSTLSCNGAIQARSGNFGSNGAEGGGGSGGAIRLVADVINGTCSFSATGGNISGGNNGGVGRIRVEANNLLNLIATSSPPLASGLPNPVWPPTNTPRIRTTLLGGQAIPADPRAGLLFPNTDLAFSNPNPVTLQIDAENVPLNWTMQVRLVRKSGAQTLTPATFLSGTEAASIWTANLTLPNGISAIQVRAAAP